MPGADKIVKIRTNSSSCECEVISYQKCRNLNVMFAQKRRTLKKLLSCFTFTYWERTIMTYSLGVNGPLGYIYTEHLFTSPAWCELFHGHHYRIGKRELWTTSYLVTNTELQPFSLEQTMYWTSISCINQWQYNAHQYLPSMISIRRQWIKWKTIKKKSVFDK